MSARFQFRPMRMGDVEAVHAIEAAIYPNPWRLESFRFEVEDNISSQPWVALTRDDEGNERVVAYLIVWLLVDELHIANLAVHPDYRRKGLAKRLLRDALQRAAETGFLRSTLEVRASNLVAQALYHSVGFEPIGIRKNYYQDNREDALIMGIEDLSEFAPTQAEPL